MIFFKKYSFSFVMLASHLSQVHKTGFPFYRRYCTARLRRLYKSLKFTHGRGKYTRRAINESTITDIRCDPEADTICLRYFCSHLVFKVCCNSLKFYDSDILLCISSSISIKNFKSWCLLSHAGRKVLNMGLK